MESTPYSPPDNEEEKQFLNERVTSPKKGPKGHNKVIIA